MGKGVIRKPPAGIQKGATFLKRLGAQLSMQPGMPSFARKNKKKSPVRKRAPKR